jgi:hypothetical protein
MSKEQVQISVGQEVRVPIRFGEAIVEVLGITPGSIIVDLIGDGLGAYAVPAKDVRDLEGNPARIMKGDPGRIYR